MPITEYAQAREEMTASAMRKETLASSEKVEARPLLHDHALGDPIPSQSATRRMKEKAKSILPDRLFLCLLH
ncbi:hypothetical protein SB753_40510, partial [Paraburkholderia sp. SIMBA_053]